MIELRHLRYFIAVAEELHFGRAAERLHMAQPPLSQQIRQLEDELGFALFYRTKRVVQLTEAGQIFLDEVRPMFRQLDRAIQRGQLASRGEVGQLVIGFVSSSMYNVLPRILQTFRNQVPGVTLTLAELTTDQQIQQLSDGEIDVGLMRPPVDNLQFDTLLLLQESLVVALPATHPLANQTNLALKALATEPFILFPRPLAPGLYDQIISLCQTANFSPIVAQEAVQMQTIISLVAAEMGIAIVPASIQNLQRTGVEYRSINAQTPQASILLVWRHHDPSPVVQRFVEIAQRI